VNPVAGVEPRRWLVPRIHGERNCVSPLLACPVHDTTTAASPTPQPRANGATQSEISSIALSALR
jgi:hypothetical protein